MPSIVPRMTIIFAFVLYLAACVAPAVYMEGGSRVPGYNLLLFGFMVMDQGVYAWWSNLLLVVAWGMISNRHWIFASVGEVLALVALGVGLTTFNLTRIPGGTGYTPMGGFGLGTYLWFASIGVTIVGAAICLIWTLRKR